MFHRVRNLMNVLGARVTLLSKIYNQQSSSNRLPRDEVSTAPRVFACEIFCSNVYLSCVYVLLTEGRLDTVGLIVK